ncbi:MAG: hypothetical protein DPW09_30585 [Anaerolineae bacterium]|nr:hypothetical protein [Anaerolineales bacterium]MCQ3977796.1 hypothetical protein [Anaerolineae bacterium]
MLRQMWSALTGRNRRLLDLAEIEANCTILASTFAGRQTVSLSQIRGTATSARRYDFDADFRPLKSHSESRWQHIAAVRRRGVKLTPVALVQVGNTYFVEDGHHRISVAKAYGEQVIEAEVIVWRVTGPLPWEQAIAALA